MSLPELNPIIGASGDFAFSMMPPRDAPDLPFENRHQDDETFWLLLAKLDNAYVLRFPGLADFEVDLASRKIACYPEPDIPRNTLVHLLLDQVLPRAISHMRGPVIHASALVIKDRAFAFLGQSGLGKSTLSASLCQQGYALLSDDALSLEKKGEHILVHPAYPALRLWKDTASHYGAEALHARQVAHYSEKLLVDPQAFWSQPCPLHAIFVLTNADTTTTKLTPISHKDAVIQLVGASFKLDASDARQNIIDFELFTQIAQNIPFYYLAYPRDFSAMPLIHQLLLETLSLH